MTLIPVLRAYNDLGLAGSFLAVWLAHSGYGLPLGIYLLRNYIGSLPRDLIEAAAVDGASHLKIFMRLIVPLSMPAIASFAVFQFLWVWNDLLVALGYLGGNQDVAPVTLVLGICSPLELLFRWWCRWRYFLPYSGTLCEGCWRVL